MEAELIDVSECKKNLDIEIPQEVVDQEIAHIAQEFARRARVPGFRPGKAPVGVVKTRFRDEILSEVMQHLMPKYVGDAIEERKLEIVQAPRFESVDYSPGKPLRFKAVFEVYPNLNIENYVGIPVEQVSSKVEDSEVDASLKKLQEEMAELVPVDEQDRTVKEGDFAEISFNGTIEGSEEPPVIFSERRSARKRRSQFSTGRIIRSRDWPEGPSSTRSPSTLSSKRKFRKSTTNSPSAWVTTKRWTS